MNPPQKKGDVGLNPKGRPKGAKDRKTILAELGAEILEMETLGGKKKKVTAREALYLTAFLKAVREKDLAAIKLLSDYEDGTAVQNTSNKNENLNMEVPLFPEDNVCEDESD